MKTLLLITALLFASNASWAESHNKKMKCGHEAWKASNPTQEQETAAQAYFAPVKKMIQDNRNGIKEAKQAFIATLKTHPIVKADVATTGKALLKLVLPIKKAAFSAVIDTINLLSVSQRQMFDASMLLCMKQPMESDLTGIDWQHIDFADSF